MCVCVCVCVLCEGMCAFVCVCVCVCVCMHAHASACMCARGGIWEVYIQNKRGDNYVTLLGNYWFMYTQAHISQLMEQITMLFEKLEQEKERAERLEGQVNDVTELHQHEVWEGRGVDTLSQDYKMTT